MKMVQSTSIDTYRCIETAATLNHNDSHVNTNTTNRPIFRRRRVVNVAAITDVEDARSCSAQGWDYQTSYPATISNIPHYVLVRKE